MQVEKLKTIDADTLLSTPMRKTLFVVDGLIPQGLSVLSGSSVKSARAGLCFGSAFKWREDSLCGNLKPTRARCFIFAWKILTQEYKAACIKSQTKHRPNFTLPQQVYKSATAWNSKSNSIFPTFRKQSLSLSTPFKRYEIQKAPAEKAECMQATMTMFRR